MVDKLESENQSNRIFREVSDYYGKILESSKDLKTDACCTTEAPPQHVKDALKNIHTEISSRYYGCGLVIPPSLKDQKILDLGCGTGRDVYLLSQLVGENGFVTGVDMTEEQLNVAIKHTDYQTNAFQYSKPNVNFKLGNIEDLDQMDIPNDFYDIVVSNCVLNLSPQKEKVLNNVFNCLKSGGEMYFSDVYSDRRIPDNLKQDPVLYGECLSGALYWNDFLNLARSCGFSDPRLVEHRPLTIQNPEVEEKLGNIQFQSATYRLIKSESLESSCEDYGQAVRYLGTTEHHPSKFPLDRAQIFEKGKMTSVCANTYHMLKHTRFNKDFEFFGDLSTHFGTFPNCMIANPFSTSGSSDTSLDNNSDSCCS